MTARTAHPYYFYDALQESPAAVAGVVEATKGSVKELAAGLDPTGRVFLVGIGTSLHAARVGEAAISMHVPAVDARAFHAFDFAVNGPALYAEDTVVAVSHRGNKRYSAASLKRAEEAGARTVLITGQDAKLQGTDPAGLVIHTVRQDPSAAHTVSYVGAAVVLLSLACELAEAAGGTGSLTGVLDGLGSGMAAAMNEDVIAQAARPVAEARRIWLTGAGVDGVTAEEIALKIKETSFKQAEGMGIEALLHGPFQASDPDDVFVLIDTGQPGSDRTRELVPMIKRIGAGLVVVGTDSLGAEHHLPVPATAPPFGAISCIGALHLLTYHVALEAKTNPDAFRLDDESYAAAYKMASL